jgi:hypothetical protein
MFIYLEWLLHVLKWPILIATFGLLITCILYGALQFGRERRR